MHLGEEIFSCIFQLSTSLLILSKHRGEDVPGGGGGGLLYGTDGDARRKF